MSKDDQEALLTAEPAKTHCPSCSDFDEDCEDIADKVHCYVYAPERGMCPYLRAALNTKEQQP